MKKTDPVYAHMHDKERTRNLVVFREVSPQITRFFEDLDEWGRSVDLPDLIHELERRCGYVPFSCVDEGSLKAYTRAVRRQTCVFLAVYPLEGDLVRFDKVRFF